MNEFDNRYRSPSSDFMRTSLLIDDEPDDPQPFALDQSKLNVADRVRTNKLAWRGQFSPQLIEYLLKTVCEGRSNIFDPFAGSGTVLYEALASGRSGCGVEINPAAWHLANLSLFSTLSSAEKSAVQREFTQWLLEVAESETCELQTLDVSGSIGGEFLLLAKSAAIILGMANSPDITRKAILTGGSTVSRVLSQVDKTRGKALCQLADARANGIEDQQFDAVITSPPYINVFNYHQNYRPAVEMLGWKPLDAAKVEIGANRKHRQNRFLTVTQYCLDMYEALMSTARVMRRNAPLVIVLGRTSNVLGGAFKNSEILKDLVSSTGQFGKIKQAERVFMNRFGEDIYEDILIAEKLITSTPPKGLEREIGRRALISARGDIPAKNRTLLEEAIESVEKVHPSAPFSLSVPRVFAALKDQSRWK